MKYRGVGDHLLCLLSIMVRVDCGFFSGSVLFKQCTFKVPNSSHNCCYDLHSTMKRHFSASESMGRRPKQLMLPIHLALYREIDWKKHSLFSICVVIFKRCVCDPCHAITESYLNLLNLSAFVLMEFLSKDKSLSVAPLAYLILLIMR